MSGYIIGMEFMQDLATYPGNSIIDSEEKV